MKQNKLLILCALLMLAFTACSSDDDDINVADWAKTRTYLKSVSGERGKVYYNQNVKKWYIHSAVPKTIDSVNDYYPVVMDGSFKVEGMDVMISGEVYGVDGEIPVTLGGQENYYIVLKNIVKVESETALLGKWTLVEIENGPGSLGGDQTWREEIPKSYSYVIEFKSDGTMSMPEECATTPAQHHYVFLKDTEHYPSTFPVVLIDEVPFGYAFENNKLRLHYEGAYTCDHIPATFVFQRFVGKLYD